jgi:hypothetical protein
MHECREGQKAGKEKKITERSAKKRTTNDEVEKNKERDRKKTSKKQHS